MLFSLSFFTSLSLSHPRFSDERLLGRDAIDQSLQLAIFFDVAVPAHIIQV